MFGETVDYWLLKPLTHERNRATDDELDREAGQPDRPRKDAPAHSAYTLEQARDYARKAAELYFRGHFPLDPELSYLDLGCGTGRLSIGLSLLGITSIVGMDIVKRDVSVANTIAKVLPHHLRQPRFVHLDGKPVDNRTYDVVVALAVMEHVSAPWQFLEGVRNLLKPEGRAFVSMTPFRGPLGDHMRPFFRVQIPWRGVLFSEQAILRLRRECFRPSTPARRYRDIEGGLNGITIAEYFRNIKSAGLDVVAHRFDPHFVRYKRFWPLAPLSCVLRRIPWVREYCTFNIYSVLRRANSLASGSSAR